MAPARCARHAGVRAFRVLYHVLFLVYSFLPVLSPFTLFSGPEFFNTRSQQGVCCCLPFALVVTRLVLSFLLLVEIRNHWLRCTPFCLCCFTFLSRSAKQVTGTPLERFPQIQSRSAEWFIPGTSAAIRPAGCCCYTASHVLDAFASRGGVPNRG